MNSRRMKHSPCDESHLHSPAVLQESLRNCLQVQGSDHRYGGNNNNTCRLLDVHHVPGTTLTPLHDTTLSRLILTTALWYGMVPYPVRAYAGVSEFDSQ